jgi:hypothetical protein
MQKQRGIIIIFDRGGCKKDDGRNDGQGKPGYSARVVVCHKVNCVVSATALPFVLRSSPSSPSIVPFSRSRSPGCVYSLSSDFHPLSTTLCAGGARTRAVASRSRGTEQRRQRACESPAPSVAAVQHYMLIAHRTWQHAVRVTARPSLCPPCPPFRSPRRRYPGNQVIIIPTV